MDGNEHRAPLKRAAARRSLDLVSSPFRPVSLALVAWNYYCPRLLNLFSSCFGDHVMDGQRSVLDVYPSPLADFRLNYIASTPEAPQTPESRTDPDSSLIIDYDCAGRQFVDFFSRLGVWWSPAAYFGIDHGGLASQREGKHFMAPLARVSVRDAVSGATLFGDPGAQTMGHPWGVVQHGQSGALRLSVTVVYAERDVVLLKVALENTGQSPRKLQLCLHAQAAQDDWDKRVEFHTAARNDVVITMQTSAPTSEMRLRHEPDFSIVTGWRTSFKVVEPESENGKFSVASECFSLPPGTRRDFSIHVSATSRADGGANELKQRLQDLATSPDDAVAAAQQRWTDLLTMLPTSLIRQRWSSDLAARPEQELDRLLPSLVHRAMVVLSHNTIAPQPESNYGQMMGRFRGTFPCRQFYEGFWIWDSAFQALGFAEWDVELAKENIRVVLGNQMPDGRLCMLHPDAALPSGQPPLFSWVAMRVYGKQREQNAHAATEFLAEVYPKLKRWNDWWFRCRDKNGNGLAEWGTNLESGWDDSPRWDNADGNAGWNNDHEATRYEAADLNAYLIKDLRALAQMATTLEYHADAADWNQKADRLAQLVVDVLYDPQENRFYDTDFFTGKRHRVLTPASLLPLWAGVPLPKRKIDAMIQETLLSPARFFGEFPFPVVAYDEWAHDKNGSAGYWRGPVWLNIAYLMVETLAQHGFASEAREASSRLLKMVNRAGIHENYNARSGDAGTNSRANFSWSAAMVVALAMRGSSELQPTIPRASFSASGAVHIGVRLRDRQIYGRRKEVWVHLANGTQQTLTGKLHVDLPQGWGLQIHDDWASPEDGWIDAGSKLPFELLPGASKERQVRLLIPDPVDADGDECEISLRCVTTGTASAADARAVVRLQRERVAPFPWLNPKTARDLRGVLHAGDRFHFVFDGREIGRSQPGLVGLLNGQMEFLGRQAVAVHVGRRDFIRYAIHLLNNYPGAKPLRLDLERLLTTPENPLEADEQCRKILERFVQSTRDMADG